MEVGPVRTVDVKVERRDLAEALEHRRQLLDPWCGCLVFQAIKAAGVDIAECFSSHFTVKQVDGQTCLGGLIDKAGQALVTAFDTAHTDRDVDRLRKSLPAKFTVEMMSGNPGDTKR